MEEGKQKASYSNEELEKDILHMAEKQIEEKRLTEIKRVSDQIDKEREGINTLLNMISERLIFKKIDDYTRKYTIVTPEIFKEDYLSEPKDRYSNKGISWNGEWNSGKNSYMHVVMVNGIRYYDMRYILCKYEKDVENLRQRMSKAEDELRKVESQLEDTRYQYPVLVKMMKDWAEWHNSHQMKFDLE
jgi:hypothetical protein